MGRARSKGLVEIEILNPRAVTQDSHQTVDDKVYGGGDGMLMRADVLQASLSQAQSQGFESARVIYLSPQGRKLDDSFCRELAKEVSLILVCGRYAGVDQRFLVRNQVEEVSIGDFVLSGGELAAAVLIEAVARKLPGFLGHQDSVERDSFASELQGLLEAPQFTRPEVWEGYKVPSVLLSGHHEKVAEWRRKLSLLNTLKKRPDLLSLAQRQSPEMREALAWAKALPHEEKLLLGLDRLAEDKLDLWDECEMEGLNLSDQVFPAQDFSTPDFQASEAYAQDFPAWPKLAVALVHYPIKDKAGNTVATNITNFDIHDISRAVKVYGVERYYLVHPMRDQLAFVERILDHWRVGEGAFYNSSRRSSLERTETAKDLSEAFERWFEKLKAEGVENRPLLIMTHARPVEGLKEWSCSALRKAIFSGQPLFLVFGTGYGLTDDFMRNSDGLLESIKGAPPEDFRHLSVRSAVAIYLDRLLGPC